MRYFRLIIATSDGAPQSFAAPAFLPLFERSFIGTSSPPPDQTATPPIHDSLKNNKNSKPSKSPATMAYKERRGINPLAEGRRAVPVLDEREVSSPVTGAVVSAGRPPRRRHEGLAAHHLRRGHRGAGMAVTALRVLSQAGEWRRCSGFALICFVYFRYFFKVRNVKEHHYWVTLSVS